MRCLLCGRVVKVTQKYHCWVKSQQCGKCHYFGMKYTGDQSR